MESDNQKSGIYVVGIGASAGGLQAIETLFDHMPDNTGMAFVIVQHLSPKYKSLMDNLLAKHTDMPIKVVEGGDVIAANTVYLIPPNMHMTMKDNVLNLTLRSDRPNLELPIDIFFASLADDAKDRSVGVILSGTGSDGARGIREIHQNNGLVIVQEPQSAQFDGMPSSAVRTQVADFILPPEQIADCLVEYISPHRKSSLRASTFASNGDEDPRTQIARLLRKKFFLDISQYKEHTFERRLQRRMALNKVSEVEDYVAVLNSDSTEVDLLYKDLLIGVTGFFRDPDYWLRLKKYLEEHFPLPDKGDQGIRLWSAGCATGEEAYSLAILCQELADTRDEWANVTIFATDVHHASLETASTGLFSEERLENVSAERLQRHFHLEASGRYRIDPDLRKRVVFAPHNLIGDPPFTKLSLICCRNVLIYIKPEAQERIISLFHYALKPGGVLFLGSSEGLGHAEEGFHTISQQGKLFRKDGERERLMHLPAMLKNQGASPPISSSVLSHRGRMTIERELLEDYDMILDRFIPPSLLLDKDYSVLHYFGDVSQFLKPLSGRAEPSVLNLVKDDRIHVAMTIGLQKASQSKTYHVSRNVKALKGDQQILVDIEVQYLAHGRDSGHYLVSFKDRAATQHHESQTESVEYSVESGMRERVTDLEAELQQTKANLQATVEELQTSNEELQATNEELLASNEELQSTNEELHSLNEELYTVNSEFERKNEELNSLIEDHDNLLSSTQVGTIFLDEHLQIRKFNTAITRFFKLLPQDIGRPIDHIAYHLGSQHTLLEDLQRVLNTSEVVEREVEATDNDLLIRILPFQTSSKQTAGVVLTFTDISRIKGVQKELKVRESFYRAVLDSLSSEVAVLDRDGVIIDVNRQWVRFAEENGAGSDYVGYNYLAVCQQATGPTATGATEVARDLERLLQGDIQSFETVYPCHSLEGEQRWFFLKALAIGGGLGAAVLSHENITALKQAELTLEASNDELENKVKARTRELALSNTKLQREANERQRVAHDLQERLELESIVNGISSQFIHASVQEIDRQILLALPELARHVAMDRGYLYLNNSDGQFVPSYQWPSADERECSPFGYEQTPYWYGLLTSFTNVFVPDPDQLPEEAWRERKWMESHRVKSLVLVPLVYSSELYGCLGFESNGASRLSLLKNASLLRIVGEVFVNALKRKEAEKKLAEYNEEIKSKSAALEEANKQIGDEIEKARQLHTNLLPRLIPSLNGYRATTHYHPAQSLGGDFYNFFRVGDQFVFYLSDVTGHGLDAAIISVFVRNTINNLLSQKSREDQISPTEIVRYLNNQYHQEQFPYDYFVCLFAGVLDEKSGELSYCSAGFQNAPLLAKASGGVQELLCQGLLISGALDQSLIHPIEHKVCLQQGDTLFFTTDGLPEQTMSGVMYEKRLKRVFQSEAFLPPVWVADAINNDFAAFSGSLEGDDDITFLILQAERSDRRELEFSIPSTFDAVKESEQRLSAFLDGFESMDLLRMAVHEMVVNAMEHGNRMDPNKRVKVCVCHERVYPGGYRR